MELSEVVQNFCVSMPSERVSDYGKVQSMSQQPFYTPYDYELTGGLIDQTKYIPQLSVSNLKPFKCPCCEGYGKRCKPYDGSTIYNQTNNLPHTLPLESCISCKGTGVLWG